jgi:hypothetical protein
VDDNDELRWPHRDGLIWPHFSSVEAAYVRAVGVKEGEPLGLRCLDSPILDRSCDLRTPGRRE